MFWWIVLAVVVTGCAVAWWTSGRSRKALPPADDRLSRQGDLENGHGPTTTRGGNPPVG